MPGRPGWSETKLKTMILLVAMLSLTGCPGNKDRIKIDPPPKIVRVTVDKPVSLCPKGGSDCDLLRNCYNEPAKEQSYGEALRLANLRNASLVECDKRWAKVRSLQP